MKKSLCILFVVVLYSSSSFALEVDDYRKMLSPVPSSAAAKSEILTRGIQGITQGTTQETTSRVDAAVAREQQPEIAMHLQFAIGSSELTPQSRMELEKLAEALSDTALRNYNFRVEGHTCNLGNASSNLALSRARAESVTEFLLYHSNLQPNQFDIAGYGESSPEVPNIDENSRRKNRRVVIRNTMTIAKKEGVTPEKKSFLEMEIFRYENHQNMPLKNGERLRSGDHYSITFTPGAHRYAYVCQMDAAGSVSVLFPDLSAQKNPLTPDNRYRIPGNDEYFTLDATVGKEQIVLLTLDAQLDDPKEACVTALMPQNGAPLVASRGVGGVTSIKPDLQQSPVDDAVSVQLCKENSAQEGVATRGVAGIKTIANKKRPETCQGMALTKFFFHE